MSNDSSSPADRPDPGIAAVRVADTPVVAAESVDGYGPIFNAGLIWHDGNYHLFARGVRDGYRKNEGPGPRFLDYISDVLVFTSPDGLRYDFQQVLASAPEVEVQAYEDPRVQRVRTPDGERFVMTYTSLPAPYSRRPWQVGVHRLGYEDGHFFLNHTSGRVIGPDGVPDKDAVIFNLRDGRIGYVHRVHPDIQLAVFDTLDDLWDPPVGYWDDHLRDLADHVIISATDGALGVGAGAPPLEIDGELVFFFHEREAGGHYTVKVALLDLDTGRVSAMLRDPVMRPELVWEREGDVDNVVFIQGAVLRDDGSVYFTYGAADRSVGAAVLDGTSLVAALRDAA